MRVLAVNCGSSSLKLLLCDVTDAEVQSVATGAVSGVGPDTRISFSRANGARFHQKAGLSGYGEAISAFLQFLDEGRRSVDAVGHRVVRGGAYVEPAVIDDEVMAAVEAERRTAPLHTGPAIDGIASAREQFPDVPMVAVFDTAFHATVPAVASAYALPQGLVRQHGLRRAGYHGIAHRSLSERYAALAGRRLDEVTIVTLQLGSGCSAAAISGGRSVDTSMGFTPLEGLMMTTRPGDLDAGVVTYLLREAGMSVDQVDRMLNEQSGLLGVSGISGDVSVLLEEEARGNAEAHTAIGMFCYRVRKYIGAYFALLGNAQAVVFGGGVGEHQPEIRRRICEPLASLGVVVDQARNTALDGVEGRFSAAGSSVEAWVIPSNEEHIIARDTYHALRTGKTGSSGDTVGFDDYGRRSDEQTLADRGPARDGGDGGPARRRGAAPD